MRTARLRVSILNTTDPADPLLHGEELKLFNNEIKGINAIDRKEFPQALIVSEKSFKCEPIADKLTKLKILLNFLAE